jgi:hypothetical protein
MGGTNKYENYQIHFVIIKKLDGLNNKDVVKAHKEKYPRPTRALGEGGVKHIWTDWRKYAACSISFFRAITANRCFRKDLPWPQPDGSWTRIPFEQFKKYHENEKRGIPMPPASSSATNPTINQNSQPPKATNSPAPVDSSRVPRPRQHRHQQPPQTPPRFSGPMEPSQYSPPRAEQSPAPSLKTYKQREENVSQAKKYLQNYDGSLGPASEFLRGIYGPLGSLQPAMEQSMSKPENYPQFSGYLQDSFGRSGPSRQQSGLPPGMYSKAPRGPQRPVGQFSQPIGGYRNGGYQGIIQRQNGLQMPTSTMQNVQSQERYLQNQYDARRQSALQNLRTSPNRTIPPQQSHSQNEFAIQHDSFYQSAFPAQSAPQIQRPSLVQGGYQSQGSSTQNVSLNQGLSQNAFSTQQLRDPFPTLNTPIQPASLQQKVSQSPRLSPNSSATPSIDSTGQNSSQSFAVTQNASQLENHQLNQDSQLPSDPARVVYLSNPTFRQELVIEPQSLGWNISFNNGKDEPDCTVAGPGVIVYMFDPVFENGFSVMDDPTVTGSTAPPAPTTPPTRKRPAEEDIQKAPVKKQKPTEKNASQRVRDLHPVPAVSEPARTPAENASPRVGESTPLPHPAPVSASTKESAPPILNNTPPTPAATPSKSTPQNFQSPVAHPTPAPSTPPQAAYKPTPNDILFLEPSDLENDGIDDPRFIHPLDPRAHNLHVQAEPEEHHETLRWGDFVNGPNTDPDEPIYLPAWAGSPPISFGYGGYNEKEDESEKEVEFLFGNPYEQSDGPAIKTEPEDD